MNTKVPGSATACVMQLDQTNGVLAAANLVGGAKVREVGSGRGGGAGLSRLG